MSLSMPPLPNAPADCAMSPRSNRPILLPSASEKRVTKVMNPSPPIWMSRMMTTCPKVVQWMKVSTVMSPVTQVAEVATSRESMKAVHPPFFAEMGRQRKNVPMRIMPK